MYNVTGNRDYNPGIYTVRIPAGQTRVSFDIPIVNDAKLEKNEKFILYINLSPLPDTVTRGDPGRSTVTIVDDDSKYLYNRHLNSIFTYSDNF